MPVQRITATVRLVSPAGATVATLAASDLTFSLDEGSAPFVVAQVTVAKPSALQFAMMRPGAGYYLSITADEATVAASTPLLLKITDRTRTTEGNVTLQAASAEIELQAFTPSAVDRSNWARQTSVPSIISAVLSASLPWARATYGANAVGEDIGTPAYPTFSSVTNLAPNGGFEYGTTGWTASQSTISAVTTQKHGGTYSLQISPSTSLNTSRATTSLNLSPGTTYTLAAWVRQSAVMGSTANAQRCTIKVSANVSGVVQDLVTSTPAPNVANTWNRVVMTFTMPSLADAGSVVVQLLNGTPSNAAVVTWWDDLMIVEGDGLDTDGATVIPYFDGDTTDGSSGYNYDWQGTSGNSSSSRTAIVSRDQDSLTWSPGQSAWDFLQPILQASGVRMWSLGYTVLNGAVVARMLWATNSFGLTTSTQVVRDTYNLFDLSQVDSWSAEFPDGTPMYADQVVIHYTWTDSLNQAREAYDVYPATGKKPYFKELTDTPFAGIGRAQGIYNRISARKTMYQGTAWFNRAIEPGRQITITSASAAGGSVVGYVDAITVDPFRGTTEFRTKQTVAYTTKSWYSATGTWASQSGSWADEA